MGEKSGTALPRQPGGRGPRHASNPPLRNRDKGHGGQGAAPPPTHTRTAIAPRCKTLTNFQQTTPWRTAPRCHRQPHWTLHSVHRRQSVRHHPARTGSHASTAGRAQDHRRRQRQTAGGTRRPLTAAGGTAARLVLRTRRPDGSAWPSDPTAAGGATDTAILAPMPASRDPEPLDGSRGTPASAHPHGPADHALVHPSYRNTPPWTTTTARQPGVAGAAQLAVCQPWPQHKAPLVPAERSDGARALQSDPPAPDDARPPPAPPPPLANAAMDTPVDTPSWVCRARAMAASALLTCPPSYCARRHTPHVTAHTRAITHAHMCRHTRTHTEGRVCFLKRATRHTGSGHVTRHVAGEYGERATGRRRCLCALRSHAQPCAAIRSHAQPCAAMRSHAQPCAAMRSHAQPHPTQREPARRGEGARRPSPTGAPSTRLELFSVLALASVPSASNRRCDSLRGWGSRFTGPAHTRGAVHAVGRRPHAQSRHAPPARHQSNKARL
jgi:hypothetical protein